MSLTVTQNTQQLTVSGDTTTNLTLSGVNSSLTLTTSYVHPSISSLSIDTSGAQVLDTFTSNSQGHVTGLTLRTLTLADLGFTGDTDATADQTAAEIRTLVGDADDSNVFTDDLLSKLQGISTGADVTPSWVPDLDPTYATESYVDTLHATQLGLSGGTMTGDINMGANDITNVGEIEAAEFIGDLRGAVSFTASAGEALSAGDAVYISGISGNKTVVSKADANDASKMPAFGIAKEDANQNSNVTIINFGELSNLDTSAFSEGDELFVSTTAGVLTDTPPTGESSLLQKIAKVTRSHASTGSITVMGAGRTNAVPNLNEGNLFVGNASNQAVADGTINVDIANSIVGVQGKLTIQTVDASTSDVTLVLDGGEVKKRTLSSAAFSDTSDFATAAQGANADTAYGWGDHSAVGYLTSETYSTANELLTAIKTVDGAGSGLDADTLDGYSSASFATSSQGSNADTAYSWGDHASAGYLTSLGTALVDADFTSAGIMATDGSGTYSIVTDNSSNWNTAYGWGDHAAVGYLTSETYSTANELLAAIKTVDGSGSGLDADTLDGYSSASFATSTQGSNADTAYGWGDHSTQSYATQSYVTTQINNLVDSAPAALDTLNELAAALGDDADFSGTVTEGLGNRLRIDIDTQNLTSTQKQNGRTNLGLGTASTYASTAFATSTQGSNADTAYGWGDHSAVGYLTSETYSTANELLTAIKTVDGAGSGLDADTLDGYSSASFATSTQGSNADTAYGWGDHSAVGYLTSETYSTANELLTAIKTVDGAGSGLDADTLDGYSSASFATSTQGSNADTAYGWGDHSAVGYLTSETYSTANELLTAIKTVDGSGSGLDADTLDGYSSASFATSSQGSNADTAYSWGDHASAGYLTSLGTALVDADFASAGIMATDGSGTYSIVTDNSSNWNTAYGWGDHSTVGYLTSLGTALVDADFASAGIMATDGSGTYSIVTDNSSNWNTAYGWGDHSSVGYLTSETYSTANELLTAIKTVDGSGSGLDADTLDGYSSASFATSTQGSNADTAYGWGDHSTQSYATQSYVTTQINNLVDSAPAALDTLNELAAALGDDADFSGTVTEGLGNRLRIDIDTQNLTSTQKQNGRTNLGLGTASTYASTAFATSTQGSNADTAYGWGDHSAVGYLTSETYSTANELLTAIKTVDGAGSGLDADTLDGYSSASFATSTQGSNADTAYGWGDHASAGYLTSLGTALVDADFASAGIMATDGSGTYSIVTDNSSNWNTAYGWGDHSSVGYLTSETYSTANELLTAIKTVDGAGSGLDADTLDGYSSASFATSTQGSNADTAYGWGDHSAVGYLTSETYSTANELLTAIKTVDGSGSGLDADTLDGYSSASFATSSQGSNADTAYSWGDHSAVGYLTSLGTALVDADFASAGIMATDGSGTYSIVTDNSSNWNTAYGWGDHSAVGYLTSETYSTANELLTAIKTVDGAGSGLDADTLDGYSSASFATSTQGSNADTAYGWGDHSAVGYLTSETYSTANELLTAIKTVDGSGSGLDADTLDGYSSASFATSSQGSNADTAYGWGDHSAVGYLTSETYSTANELLTAIKTVDGAGSGLDADTLDGNSSASFATAAQGSNADTAYGWGDHSTQSYATQSYVTTQISNLVDSAPAALDTLNELAAALGDDADFSGTVTEGLGNRLRIDINTQNLTSTQKQNGRTNLGLGTASTYASTAFATSAQGSKADTAYGWGDHSAVGYLTSETYSTANELLTAIKTVDGAGSGLDADTLDGYSSASFATSTQGSNADTAYGWGDHSAVGYLTSETYSTASELLTAIKTVDGAASGLDADTLDGNQATAFATAAQGSNADTAYGWGDHSAVGYLTSETYSSASDLLTAIKTVDGSGSGLDADTLDGYSSASFATSSQGSNADTAYSWGDHASAGYLTSLGTALVDADFASSGIMATNGSGTYSIVTNNSSNWNTAYGWGDHAAEGYLTSETYSTANDLLTAIKTVDGAGSGLDADTLDGYSSASFATSTQGSNADTAYGWGDHASAGYLTSLGTAIVDGDFTANGLMKRTGAGTYTSITDNSSNWNTAYGWGDHASAGYLTSETYSTANELLTAIKTVDGSGSGLDADTLDGYSSASFATSSQGSNADTAYGWGDHASAGYLTTSSASSTYLPLSGGTLTGNLTLNSTNPAINFNGTSDGGVDMQIYATPEGLDFREPEDGTKIHFRIYDDTGVDAPFGYHVNGTKIVTDGRVLQNVTANASIINAGTFADARIASASNWNTAYGWGNHASAGYLTSETYSTANELLTAIKTVDGSGSGLDADTLDGYSSASFATSSQGSNADTAYSWGDHASAGYLTSLGTAIVDGDFTANGLMKRTGAGTYTSITDNSSNWNTAYGWGDHSTQSYATQSYVTTQINNLVDSAPAALDTLNELAAALGDDADFSGTVTEGLGNRLRIDINTQNLTSTQKQNGRTNLGLGTASTSASTAFATSTQGSKADTAYGWGDHSAVGYLTSETYSTANELLTAIKTVDGSGSGLDADTLDGYSSASFATSSQGSNADTAFGWGNHASEGYLTGNQSITLSGDVSGTGTTSISVSLAANSVGAAEIAASAVGASELNVSGNGTTAQFLRSDGDGTFTWATPTDTNTTYSAGSGISLSGTTFSVAAGGGLTQDASGLSHSDTSSQSSVNNSGGTVIQDITLDTYGHITAISSNDLDGRYYTETEVNTLLTRGYANGQAKEASSLTSGAWYTIASNTGDRAIARFALRDSNSGDHQSVVFYAAHHYGQDASNTITVLHNSSYSGTPFRYIRIKDGGTYDGSVLQVYLDGDYGGGTIQVYLLGDNFQGSGWSLENWLADATTPSGVSNYSSFTEKSKIDLDQIAQGGIATTGPIYGDGDTTQYRMFNDNYHPNADKLTTARSIALSGDVSGSASFDGSAGITISATVADDSHSHVISNIDGLQTALDGKATSAQGTKADTAYGWGNHASAGYLTSETYSTANELLTAIKTVDGSGSGLDADTLDGYSSASFATSSQGTKADTAYGWGDHSTQGYLTSLGTSILDGDFTANGLMKRTGAGTYSSITDNSSNWNTAYGWGDHSSVGYLTSETYSTANELLTAIKTVDGAASGLDADTLDGNQATAFATSAQGTKADTAHGWGDHSAVGYLTSETYSTASELLTAIKTVDGSGSGLDADTLDGYSSASFATSSQGTKADTAYGWGDHSTQSYATQSYVTTQINNLVDSAPAALDTLNELAAALGDDADFSGTVTTGLGNRLRIDINTQGLTATQKQNGRTNLGLGTAATYASTAFATANQGSKADSAYSWGDHASAGYLTSETYSTANELLTAIKTVDGSGSGLDADTLDGYSSASFATSSQGSNADTAFGWGNHASAGYLTSLGTAIVDADFTSNGFMKRTGVGTYDIVTDNSSNWNTAYGWGNHASAGYLTSLGTAIIDGDFTANGLMKRTGAGTYSSITDNSSNWNTAYGWGNHASAGYLTGNQTITLSGDVSGSGTTSISVTIADDSHNHVISNIDGLQTALDGKATAGDENIIDGATSIWNADGDGDVFTYNDSNPTHNGKYVGAVVGIRGDGSSGNSLVQAGIFSSDHVSTANGYYVGTLLGITNSTTTQVINSSGAWVGSAIGDSKISSSSNWNTAYGWGNHASAGYLTGNQTITLSGDASGSGTTSINVTVANDSHTHDGRYYTESESDARFLGISAKAADSNLLDGIDSSSFLRSDADDTTTGTITIGDGSGQSTLKILKADNNNSNHLEFYNGTTRVGEIGCHDNTWLRINQNTASNIYTPRYIRADEGFFVDGTSKGINGSGNFIGGTIAGASDANVSNWNTAYSWGNHASAGYISGNQTITLSGDVSGYGTTSISVTLATDSVGSDEISANAVGASELNVTGNGTTAQYLRSDGDGTFSWATPTDTTYTLGSFGITATAAEINKLDGVTATTTELNYTDGVTSNIQTQLNARLADSSSGSISGARNFTGTFSLGGTAVTATAAELNYSDGVTSNIQTQLNGKQASGTYNTIIGTDSDINTSGSTIIDNIYVTDGVITSMGTRTLTASDISALTQSDFEALLWQNTGRVYSPMNQPLRYSSSGTTGELQGVCYTRAEVTSTANAYAQNCLTRSFTNEISWSGGGPEYARKLGASFKCAFVASGTTAQSIRFMFGGRANVVQAAGSDPLVYRGFGAEFRSRTGTTVEWRVIAHNGTSFSSSSWSDIPSNTTGNYIKELYIYSDGSGNITAGLDDRGGDGSSWTTKTTTGGPTANGNSTYPYLVNEVINAASGSSYARARIYDYKIFSE